MRLILTIIGALGALVAPPWVPAVCIVFLAIRYRAWEAIVIGLLIDLTWQPAADTAALLHGLPLFTLACIVVVWAFEPLRSQFLR
ncbi:MAG: hypothetical protein JWM46_652 [Candidatus Kaiserbacteria bacterium]|nr:hypothetical protein [Candidatus Kaiserbacteria bacterium]